MRIYKNKRPNLTIEIIGGTSIGSCQNVTIFRVTSRKPLSMRSIRSLREAGVLGFGQGFSAVQMLPDGGRCPVQEEHDWSTVSNVPTSGYDVVQCVEIDERTNEVVRSPSINPYSGKEDLPIRIAYYAYECNDLVDSSD